MFLNFKTVILKNFLNSQYVANKVTKTPKLTKCARICYPFAVCQSFH